jgi:hypothetical protein
MYTPFEMATDSYRKALEQALEEYRGLIQSREETDQRIARLRETILTLLRLLGEQETIDLKDFFPSREIEEQDPASVSDAISDVLKAAGTWMTASQVKDSLAGIGFNVGQYTEPLPTITTTLSRLESRGDVVRDRDAVGKTVYKWNVSAFKHSPLKYVNQRIKKDVKPDWWNKLVEQGGIPLSGKVPEEPKNLGLGKVIADLGRKTTEATKKK